MLLPQDVNGRRNPRKSMFQFQDVHGRRKEKTLQHAVLISKYLLCTVHQWERGVDLFMKSCIPIYSCIYICIYASINGRRTNRHIVWNKAKINTKIWCSSHTHTEHTEHDLLLLFDTQRMRIQTTKCFEHIHKKMSIWCIKIWLLTGLSLLSHYFQ